MLSRFAEMNALMEEARRRPDKVAAAEEALSNFATLYDAVRDQAEADYQEALQREDTARAEAIGGLLQEMDQGPGAWLRQWRVDGTLGR